MSAPLLPYTSLLRAMSAAMSPGTELTPAEEIAFRKRMAELGHTDYDHPDAHYDYRGWWKAQAGATPDNRGHFTDDFKLPGHLTFSEQALSALRGRRPIIAAGVDPATVGRWEGDDFVPGDAQIRTPAELIRFSEENPDSKIIRRK